MKQNILKQTLSILLFAAFCILLPGKGEAFVPQTPHLLHMMIQTIKLPSGMQVHQTRNITGVSGRKTGPDAETGSEPVTEPGSEPETKTIPVDEKLVYLFPGKFRSDIMSGTVSQFYVESDSQFVKVADGEIVSTLKSPVDFYTDPLLYRDHESLFDQLTLAGVDTQKVTFQRLDKKICYFIGQPPFDKKESPGLWIDKETLFPVRYVIEKNGWKVVFQYGNWHRVSRTWYPLETTIWVDDQVFAKINVTQVELASGFPAALFDVNQIQGQYPARKRLQEKEAAVPDGFDELDRQMENFRKLYE
jgi:outer membrane lipoprotein-sorting protein